MKKPRPTGELGPEKVGPVHKGTRLFSLGISENAENFQLQLCRVIRGH